MPEARYEIVRQLACGGMAEVLLARQNADDGSIKLVVLKRVLTHLAQNDGFLKMFAHEARIASQLRHPNIVQVLEVGEHEGLPVLVMERLEGADLLRLLQQCVTRRQSLGTAVSMAILAGAARGLGYAHRARSSDGRALRLIHRDISPHNVFITRDGGVKLLDFGIAKSAAHVGLTSTGQVKGKISYMSPEQIRSLPIDARSDLWSLGVVLWETLAGEKLFTRDNDAATLHAILHDPIPLLNRREAPGLDDLIARILQRDPAARIGTAEEIAAALEGMLEAMRSSPYREARRAARGLAGPGHQPGVRPRPPRRALPGGGHPRRRPRGYAPREARSHPRGAARGARAQPLQQAASPAGPLLRRRRGRRRRAHADGHAHGHGDLRPAGGRGHPRGAAPRIRRGARRPSALATVAAPALRASDVDVDGATRHDPAAAAAQLAALAAAPQPRSRAPAGQPPLPHLDGDGHRGGAATHGAPLDARGRGRPADRAARPAGHPRPAEGRRADALRDGVVPDALVPDALAAAAAAERPLRTG
ncbi:MAG: protein kinase, partial [Deltaproteobacteria bacterium]|nr:protein kinase [Deltaproteobacteria bacterium]